MNLKSIIKPRANTMNLFLRTFSTSAQHDNNSQPSNIQYRAFVNQFFKSDEIQSRDMEMQNLVQILNQKKVDYQERYDRGFRQREGKLTEEEIEKLKNEEEITKQKIMEAEKTKVYVNFFNKGALRMLGRTSSEVISELAVRVFTGSRDVPKDNPKALKLFEWSEKNAKTEKEDKQVQYYKLLLKKFRMHQETQLQGVQMSEEQENDLVTINTQINQLAQDGVGQAQFSYGKELFSAVRNNQFNDKHESKEFLKYSFDYLNSAAKKGVYSAYFYLGMMYLEGIYVKKDIEKALDFYIKGASRNNAYCYFELSRIYGEGEIEEKNEKLQFLYLKRSAEEGFVTAQHLLGIAYYEGKLCKKNDQLALAWFRESVRNGNVVSYLNAGDILYEGGNNLKQNRLFALINYLGAYGQGAVFLKEKLEQVIEELKTIEGEKLPDFKFMDVPPEVLKQHQQNLKDEEERQKRK